MMPAKKLLRQKVLSTLTRTSVRYAESVSLEPSVERIKTTKFYPKKKINRVNKPPFAKNLFLGSFDSDILTYPEVLDGEQLQTLNEHLAPIEQYLKQVDSAAIDKDASISQQILEQLKSLDLFGQQVPAEHGGLGLSATERARVGEVLAREPSICYTLAAHELLGIHSLLIAGTEEQKNLFLQRLSRGELVSAFCLAESVFSSDISSMTTRAEFDAGQNQWRLNGSKVWVVNGGIANLFVVFAKTQEEDHVGELHDKITAFLVEKEFGGVFCSEPYEKLGLRGVNTCEVHFKDTPVPASHVLGTVHNGATIALDVVNGARYVTGTMSSEILKRLVTWTTEYIIGRNEFGKPVKDFELIQEKLAKVVLKTYAVESMIYLTTSIIDTYEDPDFSMEAAMLKVFSSESCFQGVSDCLQLLGGRGYLKEYPYERFLRDSSMFSVLDGENTILKMFIALKGLQHAGVHIAEKVRNMRNPLFHPGLIFRTMWEQRNQVKDNPKLNLGLDGNLHPTLQIMMAAVFCSEAYKRVKSTIKALEDSPILTHDTNYKQLAEKVFKRHGYFAQHPLAKNF
ncbi:complex I assembly factor ACAD9, mitochondrial-like isoform X2 [Bacillus rossius redtenbacheri]|uniref:complex I assembly factor ACAD9, mitochondrial-like isoform X2 n=1 Tax=Bacillus rossius redtenbacheri TaxID=93214 RepID=UPI002FDE0E45